ncbi:MAG TPA: sigma factor-like helix-turn-helix DNA-binding protein, partial [Gemmataceae bacterium]|nr:sigma factor-like helix-turn-helix DNA-binding protein [Gemmataceae bacterium]
LEQGVPDMQWVENELAVTASQAETDPAWLAQQRELEVVLEHEVGRLPEKYRAPLILCYMQGRTHSEAALALGLPQGSLSRHLERARELLRERLVRRGLTLGATTLAVLLAEKVQAAVPAAWVKTASEAAVLCASGAAVPAGLVSARALTLSQGALQTMWMKKLVLLLSVLSFGVLGGSLLAVPTPGNGPAPVRAAPDSKAPQEKEPAREVGKKVEVPVPALRERLALTEKPKEQQGIVFVLNIKKGGLFFSADGGTVYVQRGGGGAVMVGGGIGGGNGVVGGPAGMMGNLLQDSLVAYDIAAKKKAHEINGCSAAVLSPNGNTIAVAGTFNGKRVLRLINARTMQVPPNGEVLLPGPQGVAGAGIEGFGPLGFSGSLAFTPEGRRLVVRDALDMAAFFRIWDLQTNKLSAPVNAMLQDVVGVLPDGKTLVGLNLGVFGGGFGPNGAIQPPPMAEGRLGVWDLASGKRLRSFGDVDSSHAVLARRGTTVATFNRFGTAFFAPAGGMFAPGGGGGIVGPGGFPGGAKPKAESARLRLWDVATGKALATCDTKMLPKPPRQPLANGLVGFGGAIFDAAFSPDGRTLASCMGNAEEGYVHLWDTRTGREILHVKLKFIPQAVAFSRDGTQLAAAGGGGAFELRVWDVTGLGNSGEPVRLEAAQLPALWADLAAEDAAKAVGAERMLTSAAPALVLPLLKEKLKPVLVLDEEGRRVAQLIADLDSRLFKVREQAMQELRNAGMAAVAALRHALKANPTVEFRRRAETLLTHLEEKATLTPEQRRLQRALTVLELLNTAAARQLLEQLANGRPEAWLTQEAQAARHRLP